MAQRAIIERGKNRQEAFAATYHVVAYSRRYHWPNDKIMSGADYSMDEQVNDLDAPAYHVE